MAAKVKAKKKRHKAHSRNKGAGYERKIVALIKGRGYDAERGLQTGNKFSRKAVPDVVVDGWWIECKCTSRQKSNPRAALAQAEADNAGSAKTPCAIVHVDKEQTDYVWLKRDIEGRLTTVAIALDDWLDIYFPLRLSAE